MNRISLPLGFRFIDTDRVYEVVEDVDICEGCAFLCNERCLLLRPYDLVCSAGSRDDNCSVVFKHVGYVLTSTNPEL